MSVTIKIIAFVDDDAVLTVAQVAVVSCQTILQHWCRRITRMQLAKLVIANTLVIAVCEEELPEVIHTLLSVNWRQ